MMPADCCDTRRLYIATLNRRTSSSARPASSSCATSALHERSPNPAKSTRTTWPRAGTALRSYLSATPIMAGQFFRVVPIYSRVRELTVCPSVCLSVRPYRARIPEWKIVQTSNSKEMFPRRAHVVLTDVSIFGVNGQGQGHMERPNFRIRDSLLLLIMKSAEMLSMGFNSVTVGFSQRSCTAKPVLGFSKVCKGTWLLL